MVQLKRTYYDTHTEGVLTLPDGQEIYTLERPWLDNEPSVSCIPEGQYIIQRDHTGKHRWYKVLNVAPCMFIQNGKAFDSITACELLISWFGENNWILEIIS